MVDVRRSFHQELDSIRDDIVRLAAMVTECIPRGTEVLLSNDLRGAKALIVPKGASVEVMEPSRG